jgi:hypothetical protein
LAQLAGQITSGASYNSGDDDLQFSASGSIGYDGEHYGFNLSGSSSLNSHSGDDDTSTSRNTAQLLNQIPLGRQWFAVGLVDLLNSDQQDLRLRTTIGGGIGEWLVRSGHTRLSAFAGLVYTHEEYVTTSDTGESTPELRSNLEAIGSLVYTFHRFKTADVDARATVYPSLSALGRVRFSVAPTLNVELVRNLYWTFTLYENYDSRPPVNAARNDFGVTNSIGWKF